MTHSFNLHYHILFGSQEFDFVHVIVTKYVLFVAFLTSSFSAVVSAVVLVILVDKYFS